MRGRPCPVSEAGDRCGAPIPSAGRFHPVHENGAPESRIEHQCRANAFNVSADRGIPMQIKFTIDDSLLAHARALSGLRETGSLVHAALQALIVREASLRLASLPVARRGSHYDVPRPDFDL